MLVNIEYLGHIREAIGSPRQESLEISSKASVRDLLTMLSEKYGAGFKKTIFEPNARDVKSNYIIAVNGFLLNQLNGLDTVLKPNDHVTLLPIVSGG